MLARVRCLTAPARVVPALRAFLCITQQVREQATVVEPEDVPQSACRDPDDLTSAA